MEAKCRNNNCLNQQALVDIKAHPNNSEQLGGKCPSCGKHTWIPLDKNQNKRPASQRDCKSFLEKNNYTKCFFCGREKTSLPDGQTLECAHIDDYADGGSFDEKNIIPLCTSCHKLQHHIRHWWA